MFKEQVAIKVITSIIDKWSKIVIKLEKAIDSLKEVLSMNKNKIAELESKNENLMNKIQEAENFKNNLNKIFK